jgi:hypothetical protein
MRKWKCGNLDCRYKRLILSLASACKLGPEKKTNETSAEKLKASVVKQILV